MKLKPLGDRILIKRSDNETRVGKIYVPDTAKEKASCGIIIAVGTGITDSKGN